jgi:hypothetical protein
MKLDEPKTEEGLDEGVTHNITGYQATKNFPVKKPVIGRSRNT